MDIERAVEIVKWGRHYARPTPTDAEYRQSLELVIENPDYWGEILWGDKAS